MYGIYNVFLQVKCLMQSSDWANEKINVMSKVMLSENKLDTVSLKQRFSS